MKKWLFNPFVHIAGTQALLVGMLIMLVITTGAYFTNMHFNGAIDAHFGPAQPFAIFIAEQLIAWVCPVLVLYLIALVVSTSKLRFIDIAGTFAIARAPMLLIVIVAFVTSDHVQKLKPGTIDNTVVIVGLVMLLPSIWMIALLYNAYTV